MTTNTQREQARELKQELQRFISEHENQKAEYKQSVRDMEQKIQEMKSEINEQERDAARKNKNAVQRALHLRKAQKLRGTMATKEKELHNMQSSFEKQKVEFKVEMKEMKKTIAKLKA